MTVNPEIWNADYIDCVLSIAMMCLNLVSVFVEHCYSV